MDKAISTPKITVFMACYNSALFVAEAINSILNQTFTDFEFIIVNDGSTDKTVEIIENFKDDRITLLHNAKNEGLVYTRNKALTYANGEYIAILDSDDIAYPNRLALQYDFLQKHPEIALCGGHATIINQHGEKTGKKHIVPISENLDMIMLFGNPFINSSTMFRTSIFKELNGYKNYALNEDFELFIRIANKYPVVNIDHFLVQYRIHQNNITTIKAVEKGILELKIIGELHQILHIPPQNSLQKIHFNLFINHYKENDFSHPIYTELATIIKLVEAKYIWISDDDELFIRLDENKYKRIKGAFEKYYELIAEDITEKLLRGEIEKLNPKIKFSNEAFFTSFRKEYTSVDDLLDKINAKGFDALDTIDKSILFNKKENK
jgi:glycosyltransferase involved in cell wall biosynthesis